MANNDIIELLDILYGMVTEAWSVPLGNDKCIIEREKAIEIINEIKNSLPTAIAEARSKTACPPPLPRRSALSPRAMNSSATPSARPRPCARTPRSRPTR